MTTPNPGATGRPSDDVLYTQSATTLVRIGTQILDWDRAADRVEIQRRQTQIQMQINQARADVASGQRAADLAYNELLIVQRELLRQIADAQAESLRRAALNSSGPPPQPEKPKTPAWFYAVGAAAVLTVGAALVVVVRAQRAPVVPPGRQNPRKSILNESLPPRLAPTDENVRAARSFALKKWRERAAARGDSELPADLSRSCKFSSRFAQIVFGGRLRGSWDHQFLELPDGKILDLNEEAEDVRKLGPKAHRHDRSFWNNPDHRDAQISCESRSAAWAEEFLRDRSS